MKKELSSVPFRGFCSLKFYDLTDSEKRYLVPSPFGVFVLLNPVLCTPVISTADTTVCGGNTPQTLNQSRKHCFTLEKQLNSKHRGKIMICMFHFYHIISFFQQSANTCPFHTRTRHNMSACKYEAKHPEAYRAHAYAG